MWEIIRANKRKTTMLLLILALNSFFSGFLVATVLFGYTFFLTGLISSGLFFGTIGGAIGLFIFFLEGITSYLYGNEIILSRCRAKELTPSMHPQLFNILEELLIASNSKFKPKLYATPSIVPNAFATGIKIEDSAIVVTTGLLTQLSRNEMQGVIAHELSHIINRDTLYLTFAGTILNFKAKAALLGGFDYDSRSSYNKDETTIFDYLEQVQEHINASLYFSLSKNREYLADATAVRLTRYPEGLASALEKISSNDSLLHEARYNTAPFYIINPINKKNSKTHPPVEDRVRILRNISKGANYKDYQDSFNYVAKSTESIIPKSVLEEDYVPLKTDGEVESPMNGKTILDIVRETKDLDKAINNFRFIFCNCGLKLKIPEDFTRDQIHCPRCGSKHQLVNASSIEPKSPYKENPFEDGVKDVNGLIDGNLYIRKKVGSWESFFCDCGYVLQLAPTFRGKRIQCFHCDKEIKIKEREVNSNADEIRENIKEKVDKDKYIMVHDRFEDEWEFFSCDCGNVIQLSEGFKKHSIRCRACNGNIKINYPEKSH